MEQVKVMHEASQVAYNASTTLQTNVKVSYLPTELLNAAHMCIYYHGSMFHIRSPTGVCLL